MDSGDPVKGSFDPVMTRRLRTASLTDSHPVRLTAKQNHHKHDLWSHPQALQKPPDFSSSQSPPPGQLPFPPTPSVLQRPSHRYSLQGLK